MSAGYALLVNLIDNHSPRLSEDHLCFKRGDVVAIRPIEDLKIGGGEGDWGRLEVMPRFCKVYLWITDAVREKVEKYLRPEYENGVEPPFNEILYPTPPPVTKLRAWRVLASTAPDAIRQKIIATGELHVGGPTPDVTWKQIRAYVQRKLDLKTEADLATDEASFK